MMARQILPLLEELARIPVQITAWEGLLYQSSMLNTKDKCVELFEQIAALLLNELKKQELVSGNDPFLERYIHQVLEGKNIEWVEKIIEVSSLTQTTFSGFISGQCLEAVILGALCIIGMSIFRFPYAMMIGTLIGFTALIPIAGAYIGAAVGAFMIFTVNSSLR